MSRRSSRKTSRKNLTLKPKKSIPLKLKLLCTGIGLILSFGLLLVIGYYSLLSYLQNDSFRQKVEQVIQDKTQANAVQIRPNFVLGDEQITVEHISLDHQQADAQAMLKNLELHYDQSALFDKHLHIHEISLNKAFFDINLKNLGGLLATAAAPKKVKSAQSIPASSSSGFFSQFLPQDFTLDRISCKQFAATLTSLDRRYALSQFSLLASPIKKSLQSWQVSLKDGNITSPFTWLKDCHVENADITVTPEGVSLSDCRILLKPGDLQLEGHFSSQSKEWVLKLESHKANLEQVIQSNDWVKTSGELFTDLQLHGNAQGMSRIQGPMHVEQGIIEGLPFLSSLKINNAYPYRHLRVQNAQCILTYPYRDEALHIQSAWLFDDIDILSVNKIHIKGHVIIGDDRSLGGSLLVGLPPYVVETIAMGDSSILGQLFLSNTEDNFMWLRINLSGTLDDPKQDLSVRLNAILQTLGDVKGSANQALDSLFNLIPTGATGDQEKDESKPDVTRPKSLLDHGTDGATKLLDALF